MPVGKECHTRKHIVDINNVGDSGIIDLALDHIIRYELLAQRVELPFKGRAEEPIKKRKEWAKPLTIIIPWSKSLDSQTDCATAQIPCLIEE